MSQNDIKLPAFPYITFKDGTYWNCDIAECVNDVIRSYAIEAVKLNSTCDQYMQHHADSWKAVVKTLTKNDPNWAANGATGEEAAVNTIQSLYATKSQPLPLPFNLEAAKNGDPIITRDGQNVQFIAHDEQNRTNTPVIVLVENQVTYTTVTTDGRFFPSDVTHECDLFMAPKPTRTIYLNIYGNGKCYWYENETLAILAAVGKTDIRTIASPIEVSF